MEWGISLINSLVEGPTLFVLRGLIFITKFVKINISRHRGVSIVVTMEENYA